MNDELSDAELVVAARGRGPAGCLAYERLVRRHQAWLLRYLLHLLGDVGLAEDALQDALVQAFDQIGRLSEPAKYRGWLRKIGTRIAFNRRRANSRRSHYEQAAADQAPASRLAMGGVEARDALLEVLGQLPYPYREILVLRYVEELSLDEIASTLGIGSSAAKMRLARGRTQFKTIWDEVASK